MFDFSVLVSEPLPVDTKVCPWLLFQSPLSSVVPHVERERLFVLLDFGGSLEDEEATVGIL